MNLKTPLPKGIPECIFSLPFDIAENGEKTAGFLTADREQIHIYDSDGRELNNFSLDSFSAFEATRQIGSAENAKATTSGSFSAPLHRPIISATPSLPRYWIITPTQAYLWITPMRKSLSAPNAD